MIKFFKERIGSALGVVFIISLFLMGALLISLNYEGLKGQFFGFFPKVIKPLLFSEKDIQKFASVEEFKIYLEEAKQETEFFGMGGVAFREATIAPIPSLPPMVDQNGKGIAGPERVSETTVQVPGIDEPDIVKTDGKEIYFSPRQMLWTIGNRGMIWKEQVELMPPYYQEVATKIIKAFPPADLAIDSEIKVKSGDLLLVQNILVVFSGQTNEIYGYDVSDPKSPKEKWKIKLENNTGIIGARLYKDKIYLITRQTINETIPCPIKPLTAGETPLIINCQEIYHPVVSVPVDVTFTAVTLDPVSGKIEKNLSFVGYSGGSAVYMSEKSIYITYNYFGSIIKFYIDFFNEKAQDLIPPSLINKLNQLEGYDISQQSKLYEFQFILEKYRNSLSSDELLKIENEFTNRSSDYYKTHKRDLERTGIVKIKVDGFEVLATGNVPGYPLNQFALDEYQDNLRLAVTVGERFDWGLLDFGVRESANDVYVLNNDLKIIGQVLDLGLTERIYSVRFIEDKGYVVTFRQTDPFYVLDLGDPKNPKMAGELKIPGYSSYLHPLDQTHILGIGQEGSQVKISLFDVSDKSKPIEIDKYMLSEYWTEVANNYHAFLLDKKHDIFFVPGSKGGYIFSYKNQKLALTKAVGQISAKRAIYINDYLYIIGDNKITVLDENNWEKVKELELFPLLK